MSNSSKLINEIKDELVLRVCHEGIVRILKCISQLTEEEVWNCPNDNIPSIGNLILHLNGNVRQWFLDGFCGLSFVRIRDEEFKARKSHTISELSAILQSLKTDIEENTYIINHDLLVRKKTIQNHFHVSGFSIISHVIEHFSYHVGQISTLTKLLINKDLSYYSDLNL
ncbi:DUF1572 domain-containing protein [Saprospiraceae bacterium]|nr:DUF1572 domain-containing protein [Saprospiraceae bacterium]